ncbi:MAG: hypothetical protein IJJ99_08195 [Oscillospiraceae bacterium]|nr:hypothetical protein [Oscillospiraceae bacterium]
MRNLTIKRRKRFVACLYKMRIYVEDPAAGELTINDVPCRKLGELKNGEEKTFQIDEQARRVYVIADKLSKNFCNEFYQLPEGQEDVFLSGQNCFNPASGNAFRFDNNDSAATASNRRKGSRIGLIVMIVALIAGGVAGFFIGRSLFTRTPKEKAFSSHGMSITLTDAFKEMEDMGFTATFSSKNVAVIALEEPFTTAAGAEELTVEQYADMVIANNGLNCTKKNYDEEPISFEYDFLNTEKNETYHYFSYAYKTETAFWLVQFSTLKQNADKHADEIAAWAKTVTFAN